MEIPPKGPLLQRALADGYADHRYNHNPHHIVFPQPIHYHPPTSLPLYHTMPNYIPFVAMQRPIYEAPSLAFPSLHQVNQPRQSHLPFSSCQLFDDSTRTDLHSAREQPSSTVFPLTEENLLTLGGSYPAFDERPTRPYYKTTSMNGDDGFAYPYPQEDLQSEFSIASHASGTDRLRLPSQRNILASAPCNENWQTDTEAIHQNHLPFMEPDTERVPQTPTNMPCTSDFPRVRFPTPMVPSGLVQTCLMNRQETHNGLSNIPGPAPPKRPVPSPPLSAKPITHSSLLLPSLLLGHGSNSNQNDGSVTLPTPAPSPLEPYLDTLTEEHQPSTSLSNQTSDTHCTPQGHSSLSVTRQQTPAASTSPSTPNSISYSRANHLDHKSASNQSCRTDIHSVNCAEYNFQPSLVSNVADEFRRLVPAFRKVARRSNDAEEDWGFTGTDALNTIIAILPATASPKVVALVFATFLEIKLFIPTVPCGSDAVLTMQRDDEMPEAFSEIDLDAFYSLNYDCTSGEGLITALSGCYSWSCRDRSKNTIHSSCRCYAPTCTRYALEACNKSKTDVGGVVATLTVASAPSNETGHGTSKDFPSTALAAESVSNVALQPEEELLKLERRSVPFIPLPTTPLGPISLNKQAVNKVKKAPESWHTMVGPDFAATIDNESRRRQEAIFEVIMSERAYVKDLEVLNEVFIQTLLKAAPSTVMEPSRRPLFVEQVFGNVHEIRRFHSSIANALEARQEESLVVEAIGDVLLRYVPEFGFYRTYAPVTVFGKDTLEKELNRNPEFQKWVEQCERNPATRKLMLDSFRQRPTQRLARYPLLLNEVIKRTPESNPDYESLLIVVDVVKEWLGQVDQIVGQATNRLKLIGIQDKLQFKTGEEVDLGLLDNGEHVGGGCKCDGNGRCAGGRQLLREGTIKYRHGALGDFSELQLFLFDHVLLMTRKKKISGGDHEYRVYKKPIPLELLQLCETTPAHTNFLPHDLNSSSSFGILPQKLQPTSSSANTSFSEPSPTTPLLSSFASSSPFNSGFPFVINHLGRRGGQYFMSAATVADRTGWVEAICQAKERRIGGTDGLFECREIVSDFRSDALKPGCKITCSTPYEFGRKVVLGTESGVYMGVDGDSKSFRKVIHLEKVTQIEILEEHMHLLVLADKILISFPLDTINRTYAAAPLNSVNHSPAASKLASGVTYFNVGLCAGKTLVVHHKSKGLNSHFKALEPSFKTPDRGKRNGAGFGRLLNGGMNGDIFRVHKEFYVAAESWSVQFLRTQICVVNVRGFEIINLEELHKNKSIPDHKGDESLAFSVPREKLKPLAMFAIAPGEFLLCYNEFAFAVTAAGKRRRHDFLIVWEGEPNTFALHHPYVLAFDASFIEVRHVVTGKLIQAIPAPNLRCLNPRMHALHCVQQGTKPDSQEVFKVVLRPPTEKPRCSSNLY